MIKGVFAGALYWLRRGSRTRATLLR